MRDWLTLRVAEARLRGAVRMLHLVPAGGGPLPSFTPGSHVVVEAGARANAYSLTGPFLEPPAYEIAVLRAATGRGGSRWLHEALQTGDCVAVSPPRSTFAPVASACHHLLVAGGIGVTPVLSHVRAAVLYGRSFEVLHASRRGGTAPACLDELAGICGARRLRCVRGRAELIAAVRERLAAQPLGAHLYICGPAAMITAVRACAAELGWPAGRVHVERFSAAAHGPGEPFTVRLARSGIDIRVAVGMSLLEALEARAVEVPFLCRQGVCGECRVAVTAGRPEHHDLFLSEEEKAAGDSVMCCVSRSCDPVLELDL